MNFLSIVGWVTSMVVGIVSVWVIFCMLKLLRDSGVLGVMIAVMLILISFHYIPVSSTLEQLGVFGISVVISVVISIVISRILDFIESIIGKCFTNYTMM